MGDIHKCITTVVTAEHATVRNESRHLQALKTWLGRTRALETHIATNVEYRERSGDVHSELYTHFVEGKNSCYSISRKKHNDVGIEFYLSGFRTLTQICLFTNVQKNFIIFFNNI